jgi:photosystem II stability/assembly factor-like uncharacterized protein
MLSQSLPVPRLIRALIPLCLLLIMSCNDTSVAPTNKPVISLSTTSLVFTGAAGGGNPPRQTVLIRNTGVDSLRFTVSHVQSWLDLVVIEGTDADSLFVYAYISGFSVGTYYDTITVSSVNAANSPQKIAVSATVLADIQASPLLFQFETLVEGPDPASKPLTITSTGASGISYSAARNHSWLTLTNPTGNTPGVIQVGIDNSGILSGNFRDTIVLTTSSAVTPTILIPVSLTARAWALNQVSVSFDLRGVRVIDDTTAIAAGFIGNTASHSGVILKTTDGGQTWDVRQYIDFAELGGVDFVDSEYGWAVGRVRDSGLLLRSTDGGDTWDRTVVGFGTPDTIVFWRVRFADRANGWIVGTKGLLIRSTDSGKTWTKQTVSSGFSLADIELLSPTSGWIVGNHGTILHTDNGTDWNAQTSPTFSDLWAIDMIDPLRGWIVGTNGIMLYTDDGGTNWQIRTSSETVDLNDVYFVDANTGWAVGDNGTVIRYQPATQNWWRQNSGTTRTLFNGAFTSSGYGIVVGELGTILVTYNGGI